VYLEPRDLAYTDAEVIRKNYTLLLEALLRAGCYVGIATHDEPLVWEAFRLIDELGLTNDRYEFQMLHGVDPQLRRIVRNAGHRLRVAVPYGPSWYPYSIRRLRKNRPFEPGHKVSATVVRPAAIFHTSMQHPEEHDGHARRKQRAEK
jgi:proline dehydrogenase